MPKLDFSPRESARFGFRFFRASTPRIDAWKDFLDACYNDRADVVILRGESNLIHAFHQEILPFCHVILADEILEFRKPLNPKTQSDFLKSGAEIIELTQQTAYLLDDVVEHCYEKYANHYHRNPCLNHEKILPGLVEFSHSFLSDTKKTIFIARNKQQTVGYLCMEIKGGVGSTVIGGSSLTLPPLARHKILCDMTHVGDAWLIERGVKEFHAFTRTDKTYIQKLLTRNMHCQVSKSLATLHVNFFFDKMQTESSSAEDTFSAQRVRYAQRNVYRLRPQSKSSYQKSFTLNAAERTYTYTADIDTKGLAAIGYSILPSTPAPV
ncbi:MAG: hypothetical protein LDLANPLL_02862 [Turneriella sp.]|nr:hypothetical protein [Turneriella sp.]